MSATTLEHAHAPERPGLMVWVWLVMGLATVVMIAGLALPLRMPLGAMYWDSYLYLDAANRIGAGQIPNIDFFTPVGPLEYYLSTWTMALFPSGQPMLAASWSIGWVTMPLMAIVLWEIGRRHPPVALALVIPFAIFTLLPFNTTEYYSFPGADGFGIYNRHASQLLYVLAAALLFVRDQRLMAGLIVALMAAMLMVKVTAFAAAGLLCVVALAAGRVHFRTAIASAVAFALLAGLVELTSSLVSAYITDIAALLTINDQSLISRLVQGASRLSGTVIFAGLFGLVLVALIGFNEDDSRPLWRSRADHPTVWLGATTLVGIVFESQNTGSQELIFLWPAVIMAVTQLNASKASGTTVAAAYILAAAAVLPPLVQTIQHAARATVGMARQLPLAHDNLGSMGQVTVRPRKLERTERMRAHYLAYPEATRDVALRRELPAHVLYSEHSFQIGLIQDTDVVVDELKRLQADGLQYETIMTLDFANPFPWLLDKSGPLHIAIGADPYRAVPTPDADVMASIRDTDIVLEHQCPYRDNARQLRSIYADALTDHDKIELTECFHAYVHPRIAAQITQ